MTPSSVMIVDDEPLARQRLRHGLTGLECVGEIKESRDGIEALEQIRKSPVDILLIDIEMPRLGGLELVSALTREKTTPAIIFVTAFDHYAIRAFERDAIDYLLKPVEFDRLHKAILRARERLAQLSALERLRDMQATLETLQQEEPAASPQVDFWIRDRDMISRVPAASIIWVEAERDYVRLHVDGRSHLMRSTLSAIEEKLPGETFLRVHRSAIVNCDHITGLVHTSTGSYSVTLGENRTIPVGRSYRNAVLSRVND